MKQLFHFWQVNYSAIVMVLLVMFFLFLSNRFTKKTVVIVLAFLLVASFFSPLAVLSSHYLFSAHMTVHVLLLLCVGPLLVLSLSPDGKVFDRFFLFLKNHPVAGWLTGVGMMWLWHIPVLFNTTMASSHEGNFSTLSLIEATSLMAAGVLFSAPVIHPKKEYRIDALSGVVYLFTACVGCSLLGLLITFAPAGTYHHFLSRHDDLGLNSIILQQWHLTQAVDQQAAGLIMWVPCCLVYVSGAMYLLVQWFGQKEEAVVYIK